jgi:hypothetical protein
MPFYHGRPWFLPTVGAWYRLRDGVDAWSGGRRFRLAPGSGSSERVRAPQ